MPNPRNHSTKRERFLGVKLYEAPLAQLDRALVSGTKGCRFESCAGYHVKIPVFRLTGIFTCVTPASHIPHGLSLRFRLEPFVILYLRRW